MEQTRNALNDLMDHAQLANDDYLFKSQLSASPHRSTQQHSRIVGAWVSTISLDPAAYGTHPLRRTKPCLTYRRTKNLWAVKLLLGHAKLESTVRYLGIEVDDATEMAERQKFSDALAGGVYSQ